MSTALLGTHFDIHGGGLDLKFPHHENEIAQSCAATGDEFVNLWMHNGFVNVDDEKMSKSLGNFFTLREVLKTLRHPEVLRFFFLSSHYRGPINYSLEQLEQTDAALTRIYTALRGLPPAALQPGAASARFVASMDDDFNTPEALAVLQTLARAANSARDRGDEREASSHATELRALAQVLGLERFAQADWAKLAPAETPEPVQTVASLSVDQIEERIGQRNAARKRRDFKEADRIRDELARAGVVLEDGPGGKTDWRRG
jgi:cysteinyl-tRNA synthetase